MVGRVRSTSKLKTVKEVKEVREEIREGQERGGRKAVSKERKKQIAENTTLFASSVYFSCPVDGRAPILRVNSFLDTVSLPHLGLSFSSLDSKMPFSCLNFTKCSHTRSILSLPVSLSDTF